MTFSQPHIRAFFTFKKIPALHDILFFFVILFAILFPVALTMIYFDSFTSVGFQFTLFLYGIAMCATILTAWGVARVLLITNTYRQRERIFLESIGDGVCVVDTQGRIILWNAAAEIISGFSKKDMYHAAFTRSFSFTHTHEQSKKNQRLETILSARHTSTCSSCITLRTKEGAILPLGTTIAPIHDRHGTAQGVVIVFRDATKERRINRAKDEFVSLASHQLRTPLTNIHWLLEMLLDGEAGKLTEKQKEYIVGIEDSAYRMTDLVHLFLNVSRVHLGTLAIALKPYALRSLISTASAEYTERIIQKKLILKKKIAHTIGSFACDQRIFHAIIQNIIANAIEYTPPGGTISICAKKEEERIIISVTDSGIGIPKKDQPKIFSKLFRAHNTRTTYPNGNGLGLYLVKLLVDESGGDIWFTSEEGTGTTFFVSFPSTGMRKKRGNRSLLIQHP